MGPGGWSRGWLRMPTSGHAGGPGSRGGRKACLACGRLRLGPRQSPTARPQKTTARRAPHRRGVVTDLDALTRLVGRVSLRGASHASQENGIGSAGGGHSPCGFHCRCFRHGEEWNHERQEPHEILGTIRHRKWTPGEPCFHVFLGSRNTQGTDGCGGGLPRHQVAGAAGHSGNETSPANGSSLVMTPAMARRRAGFGCPFRSAMSTWRARGQPRERAPRWSKSRTFPSRPGHAARSCASR